ncbi:MAG TPA: M1 family aminopeptidase [Thermoanaerobaculia bacterium]|nr:M1 family aminopeptidase [Thermoanaerobaculia bacterium]
MPHRRAVLSVLSVLAVLVVLSAALPALAQPPDPSAAARADYDLLQRWRFRAEPIAVPAGGVRWSDEGGSWTLESGRIWLQEPTSAGAVTGLVFEGKGRFQMAVPDPIELAQLRRFAQKPELATIDEPFSALVLRTAGPLPLQGVDVPPARSFEVNKLARDRHQQWLTQRIFDADARVVQALLNPHDRYLRVDMKTGGFGWLTYDYDAQRLEPIRLLSFNTTFPTEEIWLALARPSERDARGRPASRWRPAIDVQHVDVKADLTKGGRDKDWMNAQFQTGVRFVPLRDGDRALQLYLDPFAKVATVSENGKPLPFLRDHVAERSHGLDSRLYDPSLVVLLDRPLVHGEERRLDFAYDFDLRNYAPGRGWYPGTDGDETILSDSHTARLELTVRKKFEVRAMGRHDPASDRDDGRTTTSVWTVDQPVKMLTFSFADHFYEEKVQLAGEPDVICFGSRARAGAKGNFHAVAADVSNSFAFYQQLFGTGLPPEPVYVTGIDAGHGQAFDGFIELSDYSFSILGPGASELFRGHEAAHQWWGVQVGAASYRDAWLGEAFAEYSAMMFVQATVKNGPELFQEIVRAYDDELNGSIQSGFSKFARPGVNLINRAHGNRIGPIGHGWRASTGEVPTAYSSQVYAKGALVLHMLRGMLRDLTQSDQAFGDVLRDFVATHRGGFASTLDFQAAVARRAPADWSWFFDEWVDGTAIPTYRWSYQVGAAPDAGGQWPVVLKVRQSDVPPGFKMSVPIAVDFGGGRTGRLRVMVDQPEKTFPLAFPEKPKSLTFNPDSEVLAKVKRD